MDKINLHSRQKKILSILNTKHGIATGKEISAKIGVSERTVRSDISEINDCLKTYDIQIIPIHGKGYMLSIKDRSVFLKLFSERENYVTKEDRIRTLILRLLRENDWCDIGDLEDEMFVSHTTLEKDIKGIKKRISLQQPYLKVERKGNLIRLEDDERKKRDLFTRFYVENWDYDSEEGIVLEYEDIGGAMLDHIQHVLKEYLIEYRVYLDDYAFIYLTLAIYVSLVRVQTGHPLKPIDKASLSIDDIIRLVLDEVNESWKLELSASEYAYLSEIKDQLVLLSERTYSKNYVLSMTDTDCHHMVDDVLNELLEEYGIDFTTDDKLFVDLTRHVQSLKNGIVPTSNQNRVLGDELRKKYPFMGDIAHALKNKLSKKCDVELGIEEEDYLLPFIILAGETLYKKRRGRGIQTAVISHYNESMSHYLMELLKRYYGDILDLHGPYAIHAKELIHREETKLVLTTVQMKKIDSLLNIPVLTVSPLIDAADRACIDFYLTNIKTGYLYRSPSLPIEMYFPQALCYSMKNKSNLLTVLSEMQHRMEDEMHMDNVPRIDLETSYYCALANGFFFCYQVNDSLDHAVISLVNLGRDISCKYVRNIKTVMYMMLPSAEKLTLGWFYYIARALSQHPKELKEVFEGSSIGDLAISIMNNTIK